MNPKTRNLMMGALTLSLLATAVPSGQAFHGGWWEGRDVPSTSGVFPNPGSTATNALTGEVFRLDFHWSGGGGGTGTATIKMFDPVTNALVHSAVLVAKEDITSVTWVDCPFPNSAGVLLEIVPQYSLITPGILSVGPGAPGGTGIMRNSFCNDATVDDLGNPAANDPLYFKAFSDYTGTYVVSPVGVVKQDAPDLPPVFNLNIHIRNLDHG